jgi:hypothetical protein
MLIAMAARRSEPAMRWGMRTNRIELARGLDRTVEVVIVGVTDVKAIPRL